MNEEQDNIMEPPTKKQKTDNDNDREIDTVQDTELTEDVAETDKEFVANNDKYNNFVTPEELDMLREFKVLDEVKSNDEDSNDEESDSSDGKSVGLPEDEIEKMLEEDLPEDFKGAPKLKEKAYIIRPKIVLEEKGINQFEVLPLDWMLVRHYSGMPVYMHRTTRVCTLSKPYFLGKGNTRRHDIPISAIPCLAYRRALEEEEKQKEIDRRIEEQIRTGNYAKHTNVNHESQVDSNKEINCTSDVNQTRNADEQESNRVTKAVCPFNNTSAIEANRNKNDETNNEANTISDKEENTISSCSEDTKLDVHTDQTNTAAAVQTDQSNTAAAVDVTDIPPHRQPVVLPGGIVMPPPRVETVNTSWKTQHLSTEQINNYCKNLFKFKTVNIMHFKRWADRRKYTKARKTLQYPTLPEGTKLITIPAQPTPGQENGGRSSKRDWVMNMNGRSYLSVFHEYVRRALQKQPVYEFKQLQCTLSNELCRIENASSPYQATVFIGGMQYGVGHGSSKRQAKSHAARASIHILIPEMKDDLDFDLDYSAGPRPARPSTTAASTATSTATSTAADGPTDADFTFFDYVGIEDPRITEFCAATCEPSPHAILRTCLLRNFGAGDRHIHTEMKKLEYQKIELTMKVGKHTATVVCKNKKTAKQRASQAILQGLHPHVRSWGSLLRLYGSRSVKSCKEKKLEEQQITLLQDKARHNEPNYAVLEKLRNEMQKLKARDAAVVPIGTLMLTDHALPDHSGANLNNVDL